MTRHASEYNVDTNRMAVWGASAGGNLAAAVAIRESQQSPQNRHRRLQLVSLIVPVTAHPMAHVEFERRRLVKKSHNETLFANSSSVPNIFVREFEQLYGWSWFDVIVRNVFANTPAPEMYTGGKADPLNPLVSPLMAKLDASHPQTHITVAACDHLKYQDLAYAQHLRSFGVEVSEEILPGVPHGFTFPLKAEVAKKWLERQVDMFAAAFVVSSA